VGGEATLLLWRPDRCAGCAVAVSAAAACTPTKGGLTENDFIVAANINMLGVTDLLAKRKARFWA
jgi:hypothetical protein